MYHKLKPKTSARFALALLGLLLLPVVTLTGGLMNPARAEETAVPRRRVNAPYFAGEVKFNQAAVFWFGRVDKSQNYADVRVGYNDEKLWIHTAVIDRSLWYSDRLNTNPNADELPKWDAVTIYLDTGQNQESRPAQGDFRFVSQVSWWEPQANYRAAYKGDSQSWVKIPFEIETVTGWRGNSLNDNAGDRGWTLTAEIPFSKLGLAGKPEQGTVWGLGLVLHDRDSQEGPPLPVKTWPEGLDWLQPASWGELAFGQTPYDPPEAVESGRVTIRHKLDGATVKDAQVGGSTNCGKPYAPGFFDGWGNANYSGAARVNIQNQGDISDWPCFSKVYVSFPLNQIPPGKAVLSARVTLHQFGGASPSEAKRSLIQAFTVNEDWRESEITWNNAPLAVENVAASWAWPITDFPGWPGAPVHWDVSGAVAEARKQGSNLKLAFYEADWAYHSGKYFTLSEEEDWNAAARPTLEVVWGEPGFTLAVDPRMQMIDPGETVTYVIEVKHSQGSHEAINLAVGESSDRFEISLSQDRIDPPGGKAMLRITDNAPQTSSSGALITIPITATAGDLLREESISLVVNGRQSFLPFVRH